MKIILIILAILIAIFVVFQIFMIRTQSNIESYPFTVVKNFDNFQIRNYEATLFTSVKLSTSEYKKASSQGFSILAGYIFGDNETNEKISMTSPVAMTLEDSMTMMFMVPKNYNKDNLPKPNETEIAFKEEPAKTVAAISFGGWANAEKINQYKAKLKSALDKEQIAYTKHFYFLGYNPPFEILNRKNEIILELEGGYNE